MLIKVVYNGLNMLLLFMKPFDGITDNKKQAKAHMRAKSALKGNG